MGNCSASLLMGLEYYKNVKETDSQISGLMHNSIAGYLPHHIKPVLAYDIDTRKVDYDISKSIFQLPNCTKIFCKDIPKTGVIVKMGRILDGFSNHLLDYDEKYRIILSKEKEPTKEDVIKDLKESKADILLIYLPVGSQKATEFYAECSLEAGISIINNIPVFIASDSTWADKFREKGLVILGDDIKSDIGATIIHRTLANLFKDRGVKLDKTYQLNTGGNQDFLMMLDRQRLKSKKISKTEAVQSILGTLRLEDENIHIGPSDYVPFLKDNKVAFMRMEGKIFGDVDINLELRLSVEDSPNSAGVVIDAIRVAKLALDRKIAGSIIPASAYYFKHPIKQMRDEDARKQLEDFINQN